MSLNIGDDCEEEEEEDAVGVVIVMTSKVEIQF